VTSDIASSIAIIGEILQGGSWEGDRRYPFFEGYPYYKKRAALPGRAAL
jgi:hypothetical protein